MEYIIKRDDELYHYGVIGMKWGVRRAKRYEAKGNHKKAQEVREKTQASDQKFRDKTIRKVNTMYDYSNKWTNRKIKKLERKGKTAKADAMKVMRDRNEKSRANITKRIKAAKTTEDLIKLKSNDWKDTLFGGQKFMDRNSSTMTNPVSRLNEYLLQRGMRWTSNFTLNSTLNRMTPEKAYEYLNRKNLYYQGFYAGANQ